MPNGYKRGAMVIQKPPSPLQALLSGLGYGITQAMQRYMLEKQKSRDISKDVIESVLQGDLPPEVMATDVFQNYASMANIDKRPEIKALTDQAMEEFRPPPVTEELPLAKLLRGVSMEGLPGAVVPGAAVTVPQAIQPEYVEKGVPWEAYQKKMLEKEDVKAQRKFEREMTEFEAKEIRKNRIERASRMPLSKRLEIAMGEYDKALKEGIPIATVKITDPTTGITISLETHIKRLEKQQADQASKTKAGIVYLKAWKEYISIRQVATKAIHNLVIGKDVREDLTGLNLQLLNALLPKKLTEKDIKIQLRNLIPLFNEKLKVQHRILRKQKALAKDEDLALPPLKAYGLFDIQNPDILAGEIQRLATLSSTLIGVLKPEEEPKEKLTDVDVRDKVIAPRRRTEEEELEPTDEEINAMAQQIMGNWINPETRMPYTEEEAKKHAKNVLKGK